MRHSMSAIFCLVEFCGLSHWVDNHWVPTIKKNFRRGLNPQAGTVVQQSIGAINQHELLRGRSCRQNSFGAVDHNPLH